MTPDEKLTVLCVKVDSIESDVRYLKQRNCSSPDCSTYGDRLVALETTNEAEDKHGGNIIAYIGLIISVLAVIVAAWAVV